MALRLPSDSDVRGSGLPAGADWLQVAPGERVALRISSEQTDGRYTVLETVAAPGYGPPLHVHRDEDEHFIVLQGAARFACGERMFNASAGAVVTIPRGVRHTWANPSQSEVRLLVTFAPGGLEHLFQELAKATAAERMNIAATYGCSVVGPPILA